MTFNNTRDLQTLSCFIRIKFTTNFYFIIKGKLDDKIFFYIVGIIAGISIANGN